MGDIDMGKLIPVRKRKISDMSVVGGRITFRDIIEPPDTNKGAWLPPPFAWHRLLEVVEPFVFAGMLYAIADLVIL